MPYKLRNSSRHKFEKTKFKITNWSDYNKALINRGSVTLWLSAEIIKAWSPKKLNVLDHHICDLCCSILV